MTTDPNSQLTAGILKVMRWCLDHPTRRRTHTLRNGLSIIVYLDLARRRHVCLSRPSAPGPSPQEAKTVLAHWPEPVPPDVRWTPGHPGRYHILVSIWTMPEQPEQLILEIGGKR